MNSEEAEPLEEQFADLLAAYERALLDGEPPAAPPPVPPPALQARLGEALSSIKLLQQLWPTATTLEPATATDRQRGRYRLQALHATGGIGQVWLAEDADLHRAVALKELRPGRAGEAAFGRRFLHEARITGRLQHPGIVPVYELLPGDDDHGPCYTMRLVRGRTLTEALADYHARRAAGTVGPLELNALLQAFISVCHTVAYAHAQGIIHRDLKSANVVLGDFGEVVLLDWGFARELDCPEEVLPETAGEASPGQTLAGQVVGTPAYMAPEQAAGDRQRIDRRTDVYGLGAILYEILTGRPPFVGNDTCELLRQARETSPPPPQAVCPQAAPALAAVCLQALARDPAKRYPAASDLASEVQRWLADEPVQAYREAPIERVGRWCRKHRPAVTGLTALVGTGFVALMLGLVLLEKEQARTAEVRAQAADERARADAVAREALESHLYVERLALAERELAAYNLARATQLLAECPPERRGWEWACLERQCQADLRILRGHAAPVSGAVFCLNGRRLVSASHDRALKVWDVASGRTLSTLEGHTGVIHCLAASPDGQRLASGSWDKTAKVWDAATGQELLTLAGHPSLVIRVAFGPDGRLLATVSGRTLKLWDLDTGRERYSLEDRNSELYGLAISPDGQLLATGGGDNLIRLRDLATGAELQVWQGHEVPPKHLAFSPDGKLLAAGDGDTLQNGPGTVKLWNVSSGTVAATLTGHTYPVFSVAFSPDGQRLVSGSQDNSLKVWDVARGRLALTLRGHADVVRGLSFSPDGQTLASASSDRTVRLWEAAPRPESEAAALPVLRGHDERLIGVGLTKDGRQVVSLSYDAVLKTWSAAAGTLQRSVPLGERKGHFHSLTVSPRGDLAALGTASGAVVLVDPATGQEVGHCPGFGAGPILGVAFSSDGQRLAAAEWRQTVRVWDVKTRRPLHVLPGHTEPVVAVAFSADDRYLASASYDQTVKLWDATEGTLLRTLQGHTSRLTGLAFRPDGRMLAAAANDGLIKLWSVPAGEELRDLRGHTAAVAGLGFTPDGKHLLSASDDWTIKQWDVSRGAVVTTRRGHRGAVRTLALSPDGRLLVTGSHDRSVRLWQLVP